MIRALSAIIVMTLSFGIHAQAPDAAELTTLLKDFLAGASRNDAAMHDRFWAEDLIYTGSSGRRVSKADIMKDVRSAPAPKPGEPTTTYSAEDVRIQQYGDTAIVAFRLVGTSGSEVANYLNSGTFLNRNGKWQVANWQATKLPRPEDPPRKLIGNRFVLRYRSGLVVEASYPAANQFVWKGVEGSGSENASIEEIAPGVFFVSWLQKNRTSVSNVINLNANTVNAFVTYPGANGRESMSDAGTVERVSK